MPRAGSAHAKYNRDYEARMKLLGCVRGPRLTHEAAERLRVLAFNHRLTPGQVVCRLLLDLPLDSDKATPRAEQVRAIAVEFGVSDSEAETMLEALTCR